MALPLNKRYEIVFLHEHEADPKWGYEKIASHIHCTQDERIVKLAMKKHDITAAEIQQKLDKQGVEISKTTIRRRLDESGGKFIKEISKPLLSEGHMVKRLQWAKKHKKFDWKRVIFTDENTFQLFQSNRKIWQFAGRRKVFCMVKHPQKVHVWGCFSAQGFENVWQLLKIKISKKKISTTRKLKAELTKEWGQLPVQLAENLVNSMGRRVEALIESGGTLLCINYQ
ncbi:10230_t:CDS:2, partial [Rhizophagus irregularis]